jgi:hypothetical protein
VDISIEDPIFDFMIVVSDQDPQNCPDPASRPCDKDLRGAGCLREASNLLQLPPAFQGQAVEEKQPWGILTKGSSKQSGCSSTLKTSEPQSENIVNIVSIVHSKKKL